MRTDTVLGVVGSVEYSTANALVICVRELVILGFLPPYLFVTILRDFAIDLRILSEKLRHRNLWHPARADFSSTPAIPAPKTD